MRSAVEKMRRAVRSAQTWVSWRAVVRRDPCPYCCLSPRADFGKQRMTIEHITPLSVGGLNDWRNIVAAHEGCNQQRSSRPLLGFLLFRRFSAGLNKTQRGQLRRAFYGGKPWSL